MARAAAGDGLDAFCQGIVVHRVLDAVLECGERDEGFDGEVEGEALWEAAFQVWHTNVGVEFEFLDADGVGHGGVDRLGWVEGSG